MNKRYVWLIFGFVFFVAKEGFAQVKWDFLDSGGEIFQTVQEKVGEVTNKVNEAGKKLEGQLIGDNPIKTAYETAKATKEKITSTVEAGKEAYDKASEKVTGVVEAGKEKASELTGTYEENMEKLESTKAKSPTTIKKEIKQIDEQLEARKEVIQTELQAKINEAEENEKTLRELYDMEENDDSKASLEEQMDQTEALKQEYESYLKNTEEEESSYLLEDEEYQNLTEQKKQKNEALDGLKESLIAAGSGLGAMAIAALTKMSKEDKKAAYTETIQSNFLAADAPVNPSAVTPLVQERRDSFRKDLASALARVVAFRKKAPNSEEKSDTVTENMEGEMDYMISMQNLLNEQLIHRIDLLHDKIALEVADMKIKTSKEMIDQDYKLKNPDKDPSSIDLDSYIFTADQIKSDSVGGGEDSVLNSSAKDGSAAVGEENKTEESQTESAESGNVKVCHSGNYSICVNVSAEACPTVINDQGNKVQKCNPSKLTSEICSLLGERKKEKIAELEALLKKDEASFEKQKDRYIAEGKDVSELNSSSLATRIQNYKDKIKDIKENKDSKNLQNDSQYQRILMVLKDQGIEELCVR